MEQLFRLRRFLEVPTPAKRKTPGCELCGAPFAGGHAHVIDMENRRLMCTCRPCYLLFTHSGAAGGKFRSVSERVLRLADVAVNSSWWDALDIPVGILFLLRNSSSGRVTAFYPSPAGATESGLPLETWDEMVNANPVLGTIEPDIEALLICRRHDCMQAWIVPVDACYELVGRIRRQWKGFDGGAEAWREIDEFFAGLREREGSCV
jgi:hypothetical protein